MATIHEYKVRVYKKMLRKFLDLCMRDNNFVALINTYAHQDSGMTWNETADELILECVRYMAKNI